MKISYSKNYNVNRSLTNALKASILAVGLVSAYAANALVLESGNIWSNIQIVGDKVYQFTGFSSDDDYGTFNIFDLSNADESTTVLTPDFSTIFENTGIQNKYISDLFTNGKQFILYGTTWKSENTYLYNGINDSDPIEIKLKDGSNIVYPRDAFISGNYAVISHVNVNKIYIFDISKSTSKDISASQITVTLPSMYADKMAVHESNILVTDNKYNKAYIFNMNAGNEAAITNSYITITSQFDSNISNFDNAVSINSKYALLFMLYKNSSYNAIHAYNITSGKSDTVSASEIIITNAFGSSFSGQNLALNENNVAMISSTNGPVLINLNAGSEAEINNSQTRIIWANSEDLNVAYFTLDGDTFAFKNRLNAKQTIVGNIKSVTTLDDGSFQHISGFGFETLDNWVIGKNNSNNSILFDRLNAGDSSIAQAIIQNEGRAVYIGQNAGSNNNTLRVLGKLVANDVYIGADGNTDNALIFGNEAVLNADNKFDIENIYLAENSMLIFECDWEHNSQKIFDYLNGADLWAWDAKTKSYVLIDESNYQDLLSITDYLDTNNMLVQVIPEPAVTAAIIGALTLALAAYRRRK